jgi:hypothetical protein
MENTNEIKIRFCDRCGGVADHLKGSMSILIPKSDAFKYRWWCAGCVALFEAFADKTYDEQRHRRIL